MTWEQGHEGSEGVSYSGEEDLGSGQTRGKSPNRSTRWVCLQNPRGQVACSRAVSATEVERLRAGLELSLVSHSEDLGIHPTGDGLSREVIRSAFYFKASFQLLWNWPQEGKMGQGDQLGDSHSRPGEKQLA